MCAHKTLPMGTVVTVTNVDNGKSTTCRVGDRGPYVEGRIIDLSPEAFSQLAPLSEGVINVKLTW
jgi:rare lipoprotein A